MTDTTIHPRGTCESQHWGGRIKALYDTVGDNNVAQALYVNEQRSPVTYHVLTLPI